MRQEEETGQLGESSLLFSLLQECPLSRLPGALPSAWGCALLHRQAQPQTCRQEQAPQLRLAGVLVETLPPLLRVFRSGMLGLIFPN